ncbi:glutamine amidotransferase [Saliphagus infecundisoli]|uniref:Glutamine amidotransferase n=1 Tax=Saliphagus infecundisoli TaxID=1849069 RepID=A0ABD5QAY3_9EURY|nr:glutamine amidotransferase [Saliphagus infecundisoli]
MTDVLLAGESHVNVTLEIKGKNVMRDAQYGEAADRYIETLEGLGANVTYQPCHVAIEEFPRTLESLDTYDLVVLSDIGADSLQLTPQVATGETDVDRPALLAEWVRNGGALGMIGGYMTFAGKGGQARWGNTAVGEALPVTIATGDDRVETPAGAHPKNEAIEELPDELPHILGYNRFKADDNATVWATVNDDPFLVVGDHGEGSTFAYATDCAPHWAPEAFTEWEYIDTLWKAVISRVTS